MPSGPFGESSPSEWYPPGHGDVYYSLYASGLLENLINQVGAQRFIDVMGYLSRSAHFSYNPVLGRTEAMDPQTVEHPRDNESVSPQAVAFRHK